MALATVLLYLTVVYVRPGDLIQGWLGFPFAAITQTAAVIAIAVSLLLRPRIFWNQPHDRYLVGFFIATLISNVAWGWFGGAYVAVLNTFPQVLCYFLIRAAARSARDLRWLAYLIVAMTLFQALNGISQFRTGVSLGGVAAIDTHAEGDADDDGELDEVRRIRGTGIFNDPNDLAMAFVAVVPLLVGPFLRRQTSLSVRGLAGTVLSPILAALYYTNSRGGVLGLGMAMLPYCWRVGRTIGTLLAAGGLAALIALGPSRMSALDGDDESAQGRVHSWSEGLQMFKTHPIFGVGYGRYNDFNPLVAHNSYVHTLAELGIVGAFFFAGMLYFSLRPAAAKRVDADAPAEARRLQGFGDDLRWGTAGMCICAMFLSRQYSSVLINCVALRACYSQLQEEAGAASERHPARDMVVVAVLSVGGVVGTYVFVRLFGLWVG